MDKTTQCQKILEYIDEHGSITSRDAMMKLNVYRLASRVCDLKKKGYPIVAVTETASSGGHYARYYMECET